MLSRALDRKKALPWTRPWPRRAFSKVQMTVSPGLRVMAVGDEPSSHVAAVWAHPVGNVSATL